MNVTVARFADDKCLSLHRYHPLHPVRFFRSSAPALFEDREFANMMDFTLAYMTTHFAGISLKSLEEVTSHSPCLACIAVIFNRLRADADRF